MAPERAGLDVPVGAWPHAVAAEVLANAQDVARRIAERVRRVTADPPTDDTRTDHEPFPPDPTAGHPPPS